MKYAIIKESIGTLYCHSSFDSEIADECLFGMIVEIKSIAENGWYKIRTHYGYEGYIKGNSLCFENIDTWKQKTNGVIMQSFCDVMNQPRIQSKILMVIPRGGIIIRVNEFASDGAWQKVFLPTGEEGWIRTNYMQPYAREKIEMNEVSFREMVVQTAFLYMNVPYRWGGKTPLGIDCSGLTSMAYMLNGVLIYRDASIEEGFPVRKISYEEAKRGDLIYTPGHIVMYLGDDKYIHSSLGGNEVKINSFNVNDPDYREDIAQNILYAGTVF
ncbi:MAG: C40 family peptidase [Bacillaceae bacterium]